MKREADSLHTTPAALVDELADEAELLDELDGLDDGEYCRECGCSNLDACEQGCFWVEPDLCSACAKGGR